MPLGFTTTVVASSEERDASKRQRRAQGSTVSQNVLGFNHYSDGIERKARCLEASAEGPLPKCKPKCMFLESLTHSEGFTLGKPKP